MHQAYRIRLCHGRRVVHALSVSDKLWFKRTLYDVHYCYDKLCVVEHTLSVYGTSCVVVHTLCVVHTLSVSGTQRVVQKLCVVHTLSVCDTKCVVDTISLSDKLYSLHTLYAVTTQEASYIHYPYLTNFALCKLYTSCILVRTQYASCISVSDKSRVLHTLRIVQPCYDTLRVVHTLSVFDSQGVVHALSVSSKLYVLPFLCVLHILSVSDTEGASCIHYRSLINYAFCIHYSSSNLVTIHFESIIH